VTAHEKSAPAKTAPVNKLSVVAVIMAVVAAAGFWYLGMGGLAVFAVGAGHVSHNQIKRRGENGRWLAISALTVGYAIGIWALVAAPRYASLILEQASR
jgi:hypothetical protein